MCTGVLRYGIFKGRFHLLRNIKIEIQVNELKSCSGILHGCNVYGLETSVDTLCEPIQKPVKRVTFSSFIILYRGTHFFTL